MSFDWAKLAVLIATAVPKAVLGVETIVTGAKQGATKKQLAMASLGLANTVAADVVPEDLQPMVGAATVLASNAIDNFVALMNLAKEQKEQDKPKTSTPKQMSEAKAATAAAADASAVARTEPFTNPDWK